MARTLAVFMGAQRAGTLESSCFDAIGGFLGARTKTDSNSWKVTGRSRLVK